MNINYDAFQNNQSPITNAKSIDGDALRGYNDECIIGNSKNNPNGLIFVVVYGNNMNINISIIIHAVEIMLSVGYNICYQIDTFSN